MPSALRSRFAEIVDDCRIERCLLLCQLAEELHFHLLRQIGDDRLIRLQSTQDEWRCQTLEFGRGLRVSLYLNRNEEAALEFVPECREDPG